MEMKSMQTFVHADPNVRTDMIIQGFAHLSAKFRLLSVEMKILNDWLKEMPGLLANDGATLPDDSQFLNTIDEFVNAGDSLTDAMVVNAMGLDAMTKAVTFHNKYGSNNL
jgi:hypothetical protein